MSTAKSSSVPTSPSHCFNIQCWVLQTEAVIVITDVSVQGHREVTLCAATYSDCHSKGSLPRGIHDKRAVRLRTHSDDPSVRSSCLCAQRTASSGMTHQLLRGDSSCRYTSQQSLYLPPPPPPLLRLGEAEWGQGGQEEMSKRGGREGGRTKGLSNAGVSSAERGKVFLKPSHLYLYKFFSSFELVIKPANVPISLNSH